MTGRDIDQEDDIIHQFSEAGKVELENKIKNFNNYKSDDYF